MFVLDSLRKQAHSKASIFYGADEYLEACHVPTLNLMNQKYAHDHEIAAMKNLLPGEGDPNAAGVAESKDKMLKVEKNNENRFLFTKITPEQMMYMPPRSKLKGSCKAKWNVLTFIFVTQCTMIVARMKRGGLLRRIGDVPRDVVDMRFACSERLQSSYAEVMHGATFPVYEFQKFLTHPFADFFSLPWEEFVLEHNRHHASTVDLLIQGEFGWDPEEFHYALQQWAGPWSSNWYKYILTVPFIPVIHFFGLNDTGSLFALEWWMHFPDEGAGGKCNKEFWSKWVPRRVKHNSFVLFLWDTMRFLSDLLDPSGDKLQALVWLLGTYPLGRPLSEGWRFVFTVSFFARVGFSAAWMLGCIKAERMFITNFTHSLPWNEFLAQDLIVNLALRPMKTAWLCRSLVGALAHNQDEEIDNEMAKEEEGAPTQESRQHRFLSDAADPTFWNCGIQLYAACEKKGVPIVIWFRARGETAWKRCTVAPDWKGGLPGMAAGAKPIVLILQGNHYTFLQPPPKGTEGPGVDALQEARSDTTPSFHSYTEETARKLAVSILRLTMALVTRLALILAPRPRRLEAKLTKPKLSRPGLKPFVPDRSLVRLLRRSLVTPCFLACLG
ncbi:unnamed protein product [Symbiodinium microadriaticum]|nr:unnamed protein product [Symbiodinium microadriaticum]